MCFIGLGPKVTSELCSVRKHHFLFVFRIARHKNYPGKRQKKVRNGDRHTTYPLCTPRGRFDPCVLVSHFPFHPRGGRSRTSPPPLPTPTPTVHDRVSIPTPTLKLTPDLFPENPFYVLTSGLFSNYSKRKDETCKVF